MAGVLSSAGFSAAAAEPAAAGSGLVSGPSAASTGAVWSKLSVGGEHTCGLRLDASLWCWGDNYQGQLGLGDQTDRLTPVQVGSGTDWVQVEAGEEHTCAIRLDHTLWCWGGGDNGQLGMGDYQDRLTPTQVGSDADWAEIQGGSWHTCGLRLDRSLWCWGSNQYGEIGLGRDSGLYTPVPTQVGKDTDWTQVRLGFHHTCGLRVDRTLWCWGMNKYGQLGVGERSQGQDDRRYDPTQVGTAADWASVQGGYTHTCATRLDQTLWCWGSHDQGQLGLGRHHKNRYLSPMRVGMASDWADLAAGFDSACAIRRDRSLWCWGENLSGQLGLGDRRNRYAPAHVESPSRWVRIGEGTYHSCGIRRDHTLWCWGDNNEGQLGLGDEQRRLIPTQV